MTDLLTELETSLWVFGVATIQASPTWLAMALINSRALKFGNAHSSVENDAHSSNEPVCYGR